MSSRACHVTVASRAVTFLSTVASVPVQSSYVWSLVTIFGGGCNLRVKNFLSDI